MALTESPAPPISINGRTFTFEPVRALGAVVSWSVLDAQTGATLGNESTLAGALDLAHALALAAPPLAIVLDDPRWQVVTALDPIAGLDGRDAALLVRPLDGPEVLLRWSSLEYLLALGRKIVTETEHAMQLLAEVGR